MTHEFHFVLKKYLKDKIKSLSKQLKLSKSKTVLYIIKIMKPLIERYFFNNLKDERSEYSQFGAEEHIHVILDEKSYKLIKHITDNMYIFSMAITLRKILEIFIKLIDILGIEKVRKKLKRIRYKHLKRISNIGIIKKENKFRQLSNQLNSQTNFTKYNIEFSKNYTILSFNFFP